MMESLTWLDWIIAGAIGIGYVAALCGLMLLLTLAVNKLARYLARD